MILKLLLNIFLIYSPFLCKLVTHDIIYSYRIDIIEELVFMRHFIHRTPYWIIILLIACASSLFGLLLVLKDMTYDQTLEYAQTNGAIRLT